MKKYSIALYTVLYTAAEFLTLYVQLPSVELRAVDRTTIQFWTYLAKGHSM